MIHINANNVEIMEDLLTMNGLSGCNTVAPYFGIRKGVTLRVLRSQKHFLISLGDITVELKDVVKQRTLCYVQAADDEGENIANTPKVPSLPQQKPELTSRLLSGETPWS